MDLTGAEEHVRTLTGRPTTRDALGWLQERRKVPRPLAVPALLSALAVIADDATDDELRERALDALKVTCRDEVRSELDPSTEVLALSTVTRPGTYRDALDAIAARTPSKTLTDISLAAVHAAQQDDPNVVESLCALAGLSYRDLRGRTTVTLPSAPTGTWRHEQLAAAWTVVDAIVAGRVRASSSQASPMRPVEHLLPVGGASAGLKGWRLVEHMRSHGVPLELLLAQRAVGSSWGAHRNSTNTLVPASITDALCEELTTLGVPFTKVKRDGASQALLAQAGAADANVITDEKAEGGQVTVLIHTPAGFAHAVAVSVARDGGTARKSGASLAKLPTRLGIPASAVVVGPGWSQRNETVDLARAFEGRIYTEKSLTELAHWLQAAATVRGLQHTSNETAEQPGLENNTQEQTS